MTGWNAPDGAVPAVGAPGWLDSLSFSPRKQSWVASSSGWFYKIFRRSDDPARDWLDPVCIETAGREYADMLLLRRFSDSVCRPARLDHGCIVYPHLSGPDMREMLRRGIPPAQRAAVLREAVTVLSCLHAATNGVSGYRVKDYRRESHLPPDGNITARISARDVTLVVGGFEVRNFRFDRAHDAWFFFDPQHTHLGMPEEDFARFIISLLMVNWGKGGSPIIWNGFDKDDLLSAYECVSARKLDRILLDYFIRETIAMRRSFAEKALRAMSGAGRLFGGPYLGFYFLQLENWAKTHEF